jgi:hypothetical protein
MENLQPIILDDRLVAIVVAGQAIIDDTLSDEEFREAQAMCLYALNVAEEDGTPAYSDVDAKRFARAMLEAG